MSTFSEMMTYLWAAMAQCYGGLWQAQFGDVGDDAFQLWSKALVDLTPEDLKRGLTACLQGADEHPPNLPQFRARCLAPGPSPGEIEQLYRQACNSYLTGPDLDPRVVFARREMGYWALTHEPDSQAKRQRFTELCQSSAPTALPAPNVEPKRRRKKLTAVSQISQANRR